MMKLTLIAFFLCVFLSGCNTTSRSDSLMRPRNYSATSEAIFSRWVQDGANTGKVSTKLWSVDGREVKESFFGLGGEDDRAIAITEGVRRLCIQIRGGTEWSGSSGQHPFINYVFVDATFTAGRNYICLLSFPQGRKDKLGSLGLAWIEDQESGAVVSDKIQFVTEGIYPARLKGPGY